MKLPGPIVGSIVPKNVTLVIEHTIGSQFPKQPSSIFVTELGMVSSVKLRVSLKVSPRIVVTVSGIIYEPPTPFGK